MQTYYFGKFDVTVGIYGVLAIYLFYKDIFLWFEPVGM